MERKERKNCKQSSGDGAGTYEFDSPPGFSELYENSRSGSPAYVKWDFDLPPVSDRVKKGVKQLKKELMESRSISRSPITGRSSQYCTSRKRSAEDTPSRNLSYCRSIKLLKEAIGQVCSPDTVNDESSDSEDLDKESTNSKKEDFSKAGSTVGMCEQPSNQSESKGSESPDLFDDSLNDFMSEYSQAVENNFYKVTPVKERRLNQRASRSPDRLAEDGFPQTPKSAFKNQLPRGQRCTPRNLSQELDAVDDDLFLEVDL